jgi:hypothetical protein
MEKLVIFQDMERAVAVSVGGAVAVLVVVGFGCELMNPFPSSHVIPSTSLQRGINPSCVQEEQ